MFLFPTLTFQNYPVTFAAPFFLSLISLIISTKPVSVLNLHTNKATYWHSFHQRCRSHHHWFGRHENPTKSELIHWCFLVMLSPKTIYQSEYHTSQWPCWCSQTRSCLPVCKYTSLQLHKLLVFWERRWIQLQFAISLSLGRICSSSLNTFLLILDLQSDRYRCWLLSWSCIFWELGWVLCCLLWSM